MDFNYAYGFPSIIVKSVTTSKHVADLAPLEFGIFDRKTNYAATGSGNGKEFYLAYGSPHTKDSLTKFYSGMKNAKKSEFFLGKEIESFEKSYPKRAQNEEWVIGFGGSDDDNTLDFECGKSYQFKVKLFGQPAFNKFNKTVERIVTVETPCCNDDCSSGCDGTKLDRKTYAKVLAKNIMQDVELAEFKMKAWVVSSDFSATSDALYYYTLTATDNGDASALFAI